MATQPLSSTNSSWITSPANKKPVLIIGKFSYDKKIYTYPDSFIDAFKAAGYEVDIFNTTIKKKMPLLLSWVQKYFLNKNLMHKVAGHDYQIIFMIKGIDIQAATLKKIKALKKNSLIIHFYPDNPFCFWNGNANKEVLLGLPFLDLFLIWGKELIPIIESAGCKKAQYFPFAIDEKIYHPTEFVDSDERARYASDVVFIGTWDTKREIILEQLALRMPSLNIALWGNRWEENLSSTSPLRKYFRGKAIYKEELLKAFSASKIVLNFIRPQNLQAHNMRTFEVLGCKSFLLTEYTLEQASLPFDPGVNMDCFSDTEELIKKIAFYVNHDSLREKVALQGYELAKDFTLSKQIRMLLDSLKIKRK